MLRALIPMTALLLLVPGSASADERPLAKNAALHYWRAFSTMPKVAPDDEKQLANVLAMPLDDRARALVAGAEYPLRLMHYGAALPTCEWGVDWKAEGIEALLPQLTAARALTSIASLRARMRFAEGKSAEAVGDLVAALALGRHASLDGSLIGVLVGYNIEGRVNETLAAFLPKLDATQLADLKRRLDTVPAGNRPALAMRQCEENTLDWLAGRVKPAKDKEDLVRRMGFFEGLSEGQPGGAKGKARAFVEKCGGSVEGVLKAIEEARPNYARVAGILDLPPDQFEKEFEQESKKQAKNPVFKEFFPAVARVRDAQTRAEVRRVLFAAALAVARDGRDALKDHPDPVAGGPFEYSPFEGGFELRSKSKGADGKPVTLTVGQRG